ncbi:MAG: hypothetical protein V4508_19060 [Pseudomonadota bacterium]
MNDEPEVADDARYAQIAIDFPRPSHLGALPGLQPKLLMVMYGGRYYSPGCTPPELWERWDICEDLARQFCQKSLDNKTGKRAHMSEAAILDQYLERLLKTEWGSAAEMRWVIRRAAELAHWPMPPAAQEPEGPG